VQALHVEVFAPFVSFALLNKVLSLTGASDCPLHLFSTGSLTKQKAARACCSRRSLQSRWPLVAPPALLLAPVCFLCNRGRRATKAT
jgi:hypothetical protein